MSIENFYLVLKENKKNHGFVDLEFVKTCHKHVKQLNHRFKRNDKNKNVLLILVTVNFHIV